MSTNISEAEKQGEDQDMARLIKKARYGDLEARNSIVRFHHLELRAYVAALCGNPSIADDLSQEVFLRALERLDRVIDPEKLGQFLRGFARNVTREYFRSQKRHSKTTVAYTEWMEDMLENTPEPLISDDPRVVKALKGCIANLPERSRQMLRERYFEELSASEIGDGLNLTSPAVRNALLRIRRALLKCIREALPQLNHPTCSQ